MHERAEEYLRKTPAVCLLAMICCVLWGSAFPCIKLGYRLFQIPAGDTGSQILFAGCRFTLAGALVILIGSLIHRSLLIPQKGSGRAILKLGLVQTALQYVLFYVGLAHTTGVKSSIIEASNVFLAILMACFLFRYETMTMKKMAGCLLGFSGVVLINLTGGGIDMSMSLKGEGAIFLSAAAYALSSGLIKRYSAHENPVVLSGYQFIAGGVLLIAAGLAAGGRLRGHSVSAIGLLIYMALLSAIAYTLWGILLKYNDVGRVSVFGFMNPVCGVILSAWILNEESQAFGPRGLLALTLVCAGIFIVNRKAGRAASPRVRGDQ